MFLFFFLFVGLFVFVLFFCFCLVHFKVVSFIFVLDNLQVLFKTKILKNGRLSEKIIFSRSERRILLLDASEAGYTSSVSAGSMILIMLSSVQYRIISFQRI